MSDLLFVSPFFIVADLKVSVDFYVQKLGFKVLYIAEEEGYAPYFAMIGRGPVSLMLKTSGQPAPNHTHGEGWDAHFGAADPDALYEEFRSKGVDFYQDLQNNTDNLRGFAVTDPNGYRLFFALPL